MRVSLVRIVRLRIDGLRCLSNVDITLHPGINLFVGANGAGKTSLLEAAFLLSRASSFRAGSNESLIKRDAAGVSLFAELQHADGQSARVGLGRAVSRWEAKVDGESVAIGQLVTQCAVICFEPGSHALIAGAADERRRYLDWGVFHVEHDFLVNWRRYQRALKQRNSLLRSGTVPGEWFEPWEAELAQAGAKLDDYRRHYVELLKPRMASGINGLLPELGTVEFRYRRGWPEGEDLRRLYELHRSRDVARGHTTIGPHRADWSIAFEHAPIREHLSRGQEKLTALACALAQAELYAGTRGEWPIVCLDDLASELDVAHQQAVVNRLSAAGAQILVTGTEVPQALSGLPIHVFHVEQGVLSRLL